MYQGPNFNNGSGKIRPARESEIWCPTENLSSFDLAQGDRVLFIKTRGKSTQEVQKAYHEGKILSEWILEEIFIGEIKDTITSRTEYVQRHKRDINEQLWKNNSRTIGIWRWNRVFKFKCIKKYNANLPLLDLFINQKTINFVNAVVESFCYRKSREINLQEYRDLLEYLIK